LKNGRAARAIGDEENNGGTPSMVKDGVFDRVVRWLVAGMDVVPQGRTGELGGCWRLET
jgi:hypothetical protein